MNIHTVRKGWDKLPICPTVQRRLSVIAILYVLGYD
jgi:hypothetical protein